MAAVDFNASIATQKTGFFNKLVDVMVRIANSNSRVRQVQYLSSLTDAQLEEKGLKREEIVHHVFRDVYFV